MRYVGQRVLRVEDPRILTGRGKFVDDVTLPHMLHAAFVRSPFPHARILGIDIDAALAIPGVEAVFIGDDMRALTKPLTTAMPLGKWPEFYALATDKARFVGDPLAMVVAESRYLAEDACELVEIDYESLPPIACARDALDPSLPPIFDDLGDNIVTVDAPMVFGDVDAAFDGADRVIRATLCQHRVANVPMETRGAVADYDPASGELTFYASTQGPHGVRGQIAEIVGHPYERLRVLCNDVGGGFGLKGSVHREDFCLAVATKQLHRPVKWIEDRNEHLVASGHAREETIEAEIAVKRDGSVLGLRVKLTMDAGAYPNVPIMSAMYAQLIRMWLPGPYRIPAYQADSTVVSTNKATYVAYRGPWEMETWTRERLLDIVARELGLDPAEVRRKNMVDGDPDDRLTTGLSLAGVSSRKALERALELIGYERFRAEQTAARADGRFVGIGFATFIEAAPGPREVREMGGDFASERAKVALQPDGHVIVTTAQAPHGQSHETTLAQVAADELGVPIEHVRVVHGDTRQTPFSRIGTGGSRSAAWASGAVLFTTRQVKEQVLALASSMLEVSVEDLEIVDGRVTPKGVPNKSIALADVAQQALSNPTALPPGVEPGLQADHVFTGERISGSGWSGGTHACTVEVDLRTGKVRILRYVAVEDCGPVINPGIVEGQIRGGVAQGIGEVLYEHAAYDGDGKFSRRHVHGLPTAHERRDPSD